MTFDSRTDRLATKAVFRTDVRAEFDGTSVRLVSPVTRMTLRPVRGGIRAALGMLAAGPTSFDDLLAPLRPAERAQFERFLHRGSHLIAHSVLAGDEELMRLEHTARDANYTPARVQGDTLARLSKFAFCRSHANTLVLESPLAKFRVLLVHRDARELVSSLGSAHTSGELAHRGMSEATVGELLGHLAGAGLVELGTPSGFPSDVDPRLRQWDFHDLLYHSRIRSGRYDAPAGAVYPYVGELDPPPAVKPPPTGPSVALYQPPLEEVLASDPGLTGAIEARRSIRSYGEHPLEVDQLGEFLYRVGRVRAHFVPGDEGGDEVVSRPYPSGGAAYELELYLTIRRCHGLEPAIYYYDPVGHRLVRVNDDATDRESMLATASTATGLDTRPDVLITMTSRFQRLSWKYRAIAYATTLRNTGVLYQTMYLVATAMGLAPCALGIGNADLAARVLGLGYLGESSVGDFLLGTRPAGGSPFGDRPAHRWRMVNGADWPPRVPE